MGYRTYRNALTLGVISNIGRGDRIVAVRSILLLIGVLILSFSGAQALKADAHSPKSASATSATTFERQRTLPAWTEGNLYIHHISTGRGNASYFVMPDGTTMLIDAGEADPSFIASVAPLKGFPARPDAAHSPGYWIAHSPVRGPAQLGRSGGCNLQSNSRLNGRRRGVPEILSVVPRSR